MKHLPDLPAGWHLKFLKETLMGMIIQLIYGKFILNRSLGITCLELAEGKAPYMEDTSMHAMIQIIKKDSPELLCETWNELLRPFVEDCLQKNPHNRPSAEQLLKSHKALWSKAKDGKYLVNYLNIRNNHISTVRPSQGQNITEFSLRDETQAYSKGRIQWNFDLDETD